MSHVDTDIDIHADAALPTSLLLAAFLITFLITRSITRLIRAGRGPFKNNVRGGVHIHHAVPGIVLLISGAVLSVASTGRSPALEIAAVLIGVGASLVLDEFALILHMQDVYWSRQGQLSVQVVFLASAIIGLVALGFNPLHDDAGTGWIFFAVTLPIHLCVVLACVYKGKYSMAAVGAFIPPVAWVGAVRLARPTSGWARRWYSPEKVARARTRAQIVDKRYGRWGLDLEDLVAGAPSEPNPTSTTTPAPTQH